MLEVPAPPDVATRIRRDWYGGLVLLAAGLALVVVAGVSGWRAYEAFEERDRIEQTVADNAQRVRTEAQVFSDEVFRQNVRRRIPVLIAVSSLTGVGGLAVLVLGVLVHWRGRSARAAVFERLAARHERAAPVPIPLPAADADAPVSALEAILQAAERDASRPPPPAGHRSRSADS